jgi:hypothetical protein
MSTYSAPNGCRTPAHRRQRQLKPALPGGNFGLSRWLVEIGLAPGELTLSQAERFVQDRRDGSRVHRSLTLRGMQPLLDHLRRIGVVAAVGPAAASGGREVVIEQFTGYLIGERGLAAATIGNYRAVAGRFLAGCRWSPGLWWGYRASG